MVKAAGVRTRPLADRLSAATAGCRQVGTLAQVLFDTVARDVPFVFACLATTDPASGLITAAYKSHSLPVGDEEFAASEYGGPDINKFVDLAERLVPVGVLSVDTGGDPAQCRRFRDFMAPRFGFTDELRLVCRGPQLVWGLLALYRGPGEAPFTPADADQLASVRDTIADGIRRTLFVQRPSGPDETGDGAAAPVVLIVDADGRVRDMSTSTDAVVDELGGWDHDALPASVLAVAVSARTRPGPAEALVPTRRTSWLKVRALQLGDPSTEGPVVVTIDPADPAAVGQLTIAARGLTARERDIVALVLQGASTKDIAATLHLSPHTVQDHLKAVFAKLGVSSRRELVGQFVLT